MSIWQSRLLEVVEELDGGTMDDIRRRFIEKYGESFAPYDLAIVNGITHWWQKVIWARNHLVKEGKLVQVGDQIMLPSKYGAYPPPLGAPELGYYPVPLISVGWMVAIHLFVIGLVLLLIALQGQS
jgi:hypothetical protein